MNDYQKSQQISDIIYSLVRSTSNFDVNLIVNTNIDFLNANPFMFTYVNRARNRINRLRKLQWEMYGIELN